MALGLYWASVCLCIFLAVLAADIMGLFSSKNYFDVEGRVSSVHEETSRKATLDTDIHYRPCSLLEARKAWEEVLRNCLRKKEQML